MGLPHLEGELVIFQVVGRGGDDEDLGDGRFKRQHALDVNAHRVEIEPTALRFVFALYANGAFWVAIAGPDDIEAALVFAARGNELDVVVSDKIGEQHDAVSLEVTFSFRDANDSARPHALDLGGKERADLRDLVAHGAVAYNASFLLPSDKPGMPQDRPVGRRGVLPRAN